MLIKVNIKMKDELEIYTLAINVVYFKFLNEDVIINILFKNTLEFYDYILARIKKRLFRIFQHNSIVVRYRSAKV